MKTMICTISTKRGANMLRRLFTTFPPPSSLPKKPANIVILESDLEEKFVRGSGPGGQSINKTQNRVQLFHKPTGISVSCQEQRDLTTNRKIARKNLKDKIDLLVNGNESKLSKRMERIRKRKSNAKKRAKKKYGISNEKIRTSDEFEGDRGVDDDESENDDDDYDDEDNDDYEDEVDAKDPR